MGRSGRLSRVRLGLALLAVVLLGCSGNRALHVDNATDAVLSVYVDGSWVGTYAPGTAGDASLSAVGRPQQLEVRSPSGTVLVTLEVADDQLAAAEAGRLGNGLSVGVPCGVVTVLIGRLAENEALAPAEAVEAGPCP